MLTQGLSTPPPGGSCLIFSRTSAVIFPCVGKLRLASSGEEAEVHGPQPPPFHDYIQYFPQIFASGGPARANLDTCTASLLLNLKPFR